MIEENEITNFTITIFMQFNLILINKNRNFKSHILYFTIIYLM